jgi:hypothetical protein
MRAIAAILAVCLSACVPQSILRDRAIEQNVTIEDVTDAILVANILRARDQAPLQFADIPLMHESFQVTAGVTPTILFGPIHAGSGSHTVAPTVTVQEAPTFDLSNLDTQEFVTGVMSPIKPSVVKYWLDRGLDERIALLLFFSSVTITTANGDTLTIQNSPRTAGKRGPREAGDFDRYLYVINQLSGQTRVLEVPDLSPVGPPFVLTMDKHLKELSKVDSGKYEVDPLQPNPSPDPKARKKQPFVVVDEPSKGVVYPRYQLFSVSDKKVLICFNSPNARPRTPAEEKLCKKSGAPPESEIAERAPPPACQRAIDFLDGNCSATLKFAVRSAGDVIHFLGDLLWEQEDGTSGLHDPITLGFCEHAEQERYRRGDVGCGDVLFNVAPEKDGVPGRLRVPYRGGYYTLPNAAPHDQTLEVLAIAAQLINLNKAAKELRSTPTVQIVP